MAIQLILNPQTNILEFPASTKIGGKNIVETHGVIAAINDAALATKFPETTDAQSGDLIWVGTGRDVVEYRMAQDATNAQLAASWEEVKAGGASVVTVKAVGHLAEVPAFPSTGINGVIQDPLRSRAEITGLTALAQWTPEDAPYLVKDASNIWHIGRFRLEFPNEGLDGVLFKPAGYEATTRTFVWDDNENQLWMLEPIADGGQAYKLGEGSNLAKAINTFSLKSTSTDPVQAVAIANSIKEFWIHSDTAPDFTQDGWIFWSQRFGAWVKNGDDWDPVDETATITTYMRLIPNGNRAIPLSEIK